MDAVVNAAKQDIQNAKTPEDVAKAEELAKAKIDAFNDIKNQAGDNPNAYQEALLDKAAKDLAIADKAEDISSIATDTKAKLTETGELASAKNEALEALDALADINAPLSEDQQNALDKAKADILAASDSDAINAAKSDFQNALTPPSPFEDTDTLKSEKEAALQAVKDAAMEDGTISPEEQAIIDNVTAALKGATTAKDIVGIKTGGTTAITNPPSAKVASSGTFAYNGQTYEWKLASSKMTWAEAMAWCAANGQAPTTVQVKAIYNNGTYRTSGGVTKTAKEAVYSSNSVWSSAEYGSGGSSAYRVNFSNGDSLTDDKSNRNRVIAIQPKA